MHTLHPLHTLRTLRTLHTLHPLHPLHTWHTSHTLRTLHTFHTLHTLRQRVQELVRHGRGRYTAKAITAASRTYDNFPLVNVSHPDSERHPLFAHATVIEIEVPQGAALVLPAYWYHQVSVSDEPASMERRVTLRNVM